MTTRNLLRLIAGLESNSGIIRKKALDKLRELVHETNIVSMLEESDLSWDALFYSVQSLLFMETSLRREHATNNDRLSAREVVITQCVSFMTCIINKANQKTPQVRRLTMYRCFLDILANGYLRESFAQLFIDMMKNKVFNLRKCRSEMTCVQWKELYDAILTLLDKPPRSVNQSSIIDLLHIIVVSGTCQSNLRLYIKDLFGMLASIIQDSKFPSLRSLVQEKLMCLTSTYCIQMSKECRTSICQLGEEIIPVLVTYYSKFSVRTKDYFHDFLLFQVHAHHPNGSLNTTESYAFDWNVWNNCLISTFSLIQTEFDHIYEGRRIGYIREMTSTFHKLTVEVANQIYGRTIESLIVSDISGSGLQLTPKRRKVDMKIMSIISLIKAESDSQRTYNWITFLTGLITKYPACFKQEELMALLQVLVDIQNSYKSEAIMQCVCLCCVSLLDVEHFRNEDDTNILWGKVWETTLRTVGLNQFENESHLLLQKLIFYDKPKQVIDIMNMFMTNTIEYSAPSVRTLNVLLTKHELPNRASALCSSDIKDESPKKIILDWVLSSLKDHEISFEANPELLGKVLIQLLLKTCDKNNNLFIPENDDTDVLDSTILAIDKIYQTSCFEGISNEYIKSETDKHIAREMKNTNSSIMIDPNMWTYLKTSINEISHQFKERFKTFSYLDFDILLHQPMLLAEIWANILNYHNDDPGFLSDIQYFTSLLLEHFIKTMYRPEKRYNDGNLQILRGFQRLLSANIPKTVHTWFLNSIPNIQKCITFITTETVFKKDDLLEMDDLDNCPPLDSEHRAVFDDCWKLETSHTPVIHKNLYPKELLRIECCKFITLGCKVCYSEDTEVIVNKLLNVCSDLAKIYDIFYLNMVSTMLQNLADVDVLSSNHIANFLHILKTLGTTWYPDNEAALIIIHLMQAIIRHVHSQGGDRGTHNFLVLLKGTLKYINKSKFGVKTTVKFINCVETLTQIDPTASWAKWEIEGNANDRDEILTPVLEEVLPSICSDYHEVRMAIARCMRTFLMQSLKTDCKLAYLRMFLKIRTLVWQSFLIDCTDMELNLEDEAVNRTVSALSVFANIMITSPLLQNTALITTLELMKEKQLNIVLWYKVLSHVAASLKQPDFDFILTKHLPYLVKKGLERDLTLQDFAKYFFKDELDDFLNKYKMIIVPTLLVQGATHKLQIFCKRNKQSKQDLIQECYPTIIGALLPGLCDQDSIAVECYQWIQKALPSGCGDRIMGQQLPLCIIKVLQNVHDTTHFFEITGMTIFIQQSDTSTITVNLFMKCMAYLKRASPTPSLDLFEYLSRNVPRHIETLLLDLMIKLHKSTTEYDKIISFHHYIIIANILANKIKNKSIPLITPFVICNVIHSLISIIKDISESNQVVLQVAACNFLMLFWQKCISSSSDLLGKHFILVTNTLMPLVKLNDDIGFSALKMLKWMIIDNSEKLSSSIIKINSFPVDSVFQDLQNTVNNLRKKYSKKCLEEEILRFLDLDTTSGTQLQESLKYLRRELCERKGELKDMYTKLQNIQGFSEDCMKSVLHRLVCTLVKLSASSQLEISHLATCCLGELGPSDLGTLILQPDLPPKITCIGDVVYVLSNYLLDENIYVVEAASKALHVALNYRECRNALEKNDFECCGITGSEFLTPFSFGKQCEDLIFELKENEELDIDHLWCPPEDSSHEKWISSLSSTLLRSFSKPCDLMHCLAQVCEKMSQFAEYILPITVLKLSSSNQECCKIIEKHIKRFFEQHVLYNIELVTSNKIPCNKASVRCMLNLVHFLRLQNITRKDKESKTMDFNYLQVARAAQFSNAHFSSILYVELWCDSWLRTDTSLFGSLHSQTPLEYICEKYPEEGMIAQKILWEAYMKICDADAVYGCGSSLFLDPRKCTLNYEIRGEWDKVMLCHDVQVSSGNSEATKGLINALRRTGLQHVLDVYLQSNENTGICDESIKYDCAWRLSKWDMQSYDCTKNVNVLYEKHHYASLRALHNGDGNGLLMSVKEARDVVALSLKNISLENSKSLYKALSQLRQLQEIEDLNDVQTGKELKTIVCKWKNLDENFNNFEYVEPILWQRLVMMKCCTPHGWEEEAIQIATKLACLAQHEGQYHIAAKCLAFFHTLQVSSTFESQLKLAEGQLAWESGDNMLGKTILRSLLSKLSVSELSGKDTLLYAQTLKLYGNWMVKTKSESSQVIVNEYFLKALNILKSMEGTEIDENMLHIYSSLARFADSEYQSIAKYFKSHAYEIKKKLIDIAMQDVASLKKQSNHTQDDKRAIVMKEKQSKIDKEEILNTEKEMNTHLCDAIRYYLCGLESSDLNNLDLFRVVSLWLDNRLHEDINTILEEKLPRIPSYKFIPILPQLVPRLSNVKDPFSNKLNHILARCASEHPHHTIPLLLALANSYVDQDYCNPSSSQKRKPEPRVIGAQMLVNDLKRKSNVSTLLQKMDDVALALISCAYLAPPAKSNSKHEHTIPENEPIRKLEKVDTVLVPTLDIPVEKSCRYENIVGISRFEVSYSLVGGINVPKKIVCVGTDGRKRPQLVKGRDDLHQDAVMQQVFTIMNTFLKNSKETSKRKLLIRTYKVVPLSQRSGVLEWCQNTEPLLLYLTGPDHKSGAHKKYYPNDISALKCRDMMRLVATKSHDEKLKTYKEICTLLHPVFRYFFVEHFNSPSVWFERRRAYIHSVATSSMIGYILGLGDRHNLNILIDKSSAEIIHIDFGIAFEMGHILPTPETVPFRLTRDIVDGMGVSGIEGVFRRSCEKTMSVLRDNQAILLTILEVLLYDPLYAWTITPSKAYKLQNKHMQIRDDTENDAVNRMAERALLRLNQKLQGTECGGGVDVAAQVNRLLQEASDMSNLSRLYFGWEPYL